MADTPKKGAGGFFFISPAHAQDRHAQYGHVRRTQNPSRKKSLGLSLQRATKRLSKLTYYQLKR